MMVLLKLHKVGGNLDPFVGNVAFQRRPGKSAPSPAWRVRVKTSIRFAPRNGRSKPDRAKLCATALGFDSPTRFANKMPGNGAYAFTEPGDYEASVDEARIELVVTGRGPFKASLTRAELGQLHLLRSQEDLASIYLTLPADLVLVAFPKRFDPRPVWGGQELRRGDMIFHGLGERVHQRTAGPSEKGFIALTPESLAFWSKVLTEDEVVPPNFGQIFRPSGATASRLVRLHASACGLVEKSPEVIAHPEVARALEQEMIHALITCLRPDAPLQTRPISACRTAVMSRLEDVLSADSASTTVAAVARLPRRARGRCAGDPHPSPGRPSQPRPALAGRRRPAQRPLPMIKKGSFFHADGGSLFDAD
jgi:hypothetical protein